jgi:hypothetical protein
MYGGARDVKKVTMRDEQNKHFVLKKRVMFIFIMIL